MDKSDALATFDALSQVTRLDALRLLVRAGAEGMRAGEIAKHLDVPHNTMSVHLATLSAARLVNSERQGRSIRYRVRFDTLRNVVAFLLRDCCQGAPEVTDGLSDLVLSPIEKGGPA